MYEHTTKSKFNINNFNFVVPITATIGLFAGGVAFLNPFSFVDNSYADSTNVDVSVNIGEMIMVPEVSQDAINLALDPEVGGDFESASVNVRMSTNHVSGYTLTMSTEGTETALTSSDFDSYKIDALSSKTSATDFANLSSTASINKWGYATDNNGTSEGQTEEGYYYGVTNSENPTTIKITDAPTSSSETNVTFATKGKDLAAGIYSNTVVFSAVANATPETRTLDDFEYMQDVDADGTAVDICKNSTEWTSENNKEYTLKDNRDENPYIVRKLADGHCWMAQNLALGKTSDMTLSSSDTDITADTWVLPASIDTGLSSHTAAQMHIGSTSDCYDSCWTTSWGNYYNWTAATAGQGTTSTTSGNVNVSICPKGWKLPKGEADTIDYSWAKLYLAYSSNVSNFQIATNTGSSYLASFYDDNFLWGSGGYWWSRTAYDIDDAYDDAYILETGNTSVFPQSHYSKSIGANVRCVLASS